MYATLESIGLNSDKTGAPPVSVAPELTIDQNQQWFKNILEEYLNDCYTVQECEQDIINISISPSALPQLVSMGYSSVLDRSKTARLRTGYLFGQLIKLGRLSVQDYCTGLELFLEEADELIILDNTPRVWDYVAELISPVLCGGAITLQILHKAFRLLIAKNHVSKLLTCIFILMIQEKGFDFLDSNWKKSNLTLSDFMPKSQVHNYITENKFDFLLTEEDSLQVNRSSSLGQNWMSYEEIHDKLLAFFKSTTSFDDLINWITANVGERVKENQFIRTLATACFEDSIINLKLKIDILQGKYSLLHRFVDNKPAYELQCLYALQALMNKLEHPQDLLLAICDQLYENNVFSHKSFVAWDSSTDLAEQEGKGVALKQLTSFFTQLKEAYKDSSLASEQDVPKPMKPNRATLANDKIAQAKAKVIDGNTTDTRINLPYRDGQWAPFNTDGKKVYDRDFLMALKKDPKSNQKPNNLPAYIIASDGWAESSNQKRRNVSFNDGWSTATSCGNRTPFTNQSDKLKNKPPMLDDLWRSSQMFGNWGRGSNIKTQPPVPLAPTANMYAALKNLSFNSANAPALVPKVLLPPVPVAPELTVDQLERRLKNILEEYLNDCCIVQECEHDIKASISQSALPLLVSIGYITVLGRSKTARLRTGYLFGQLIKLGRLSVQDYCAGLELVLEEADELIIDIPRVWDYVAELIYPVLCNSAITLQILHKPLELLIAKNHASKLLICLFQLIILQKGPNFLQSSWNSSGLTLADFMPESQVDNYVKENKFEFLLEVGDSSPVSHSPSLVQNLLSYEEIHDKFLAFFKSTTSFDDIINWIVANVGERAKENQFIRTLATACFEDSIINLKLKIDILQGKYSLLNRFVDNKPAYELQCLYALQALINKLEHPQGLLLAICDKLYEENVFSYENFVAWETSTDPAEQEGKGVALKQLISFFTQLREAEEDSSSASEDD